MSMCAITSRRFNNAFIQGFLWQEIHNQHWQCLGGPKRYNPNSIHDLLRMNLYKSSPFIDRKSKWKINLKGMCIMGNNYLASPYCIRRNDTVYSQERFNNAGSLLPMPNRIMHVIHLISNANAIRLLPMSRFASIKNSSNR